VRHLLILRFRTRSTGSVGASNIYLGLKTGFTFGPQLFGVSLKFSMYVVIKA